MQIGVLTAKLTLDSAGFVSGAEDAKRSAKGLGETISGLNFKQIGMEMAGLGTIISGMFGSALAFAVKAASDMNESMSKSQVVFGESAKAIQQWATTAADSLGMSRQQALEAASSFGNLFVAIGFSQRGAASMSQNVVQLATDLGSLNNVSPTEMLEKMRAALSGEQEPMRRFIGMISEAAVGQKAMEMGLARTTKELTEGEKMLARYALITERAKTAIGDFHNTSQQMANQLRIAEAHMKDLAEAIGEKLLPAALSIVQTFNQILTLLPNLPPEFLNMAVAVAGVTTALGLAFVAVGTIIAVLGGPLTAAIVAIVATVAALTAAITLEWGRITQIFQGGTMNVRLTMKDLAGILGATADAFAILARVASMQLDAIVTAARIMVIGVSAAFTALKVSLAAALAGLASGDVKQFAIGLMQIGSLTQETFSKMSSASGAFNGRIKQDVEDIQNHFTGKFKGAFEKAAGAVGTAVDKIDMSLKDLADELDKTKKKVTDHGKAHEDAATKAAKAWTIAQLVMAEDLAKIKTLHKLTMDAVLEDKQKTDEAWIKQNSAWAMASLQELEKFTKARIALALSEQKQRLAIEASTAAMMEAAEHTFAKNLIESIRKQGEALRQIEQDWGDGLGSMISAVGAMTGKTSAQINGWSHDIAGIVGSMPGKFGDAARGVLRTVEQWADFANKILATMHKLNKDIPDSLGGLVVSMGQVFKKIFSSIKKEQDEGQKDSEDSADKWANRITATIQGVMTFMSTRHQGKAVGVMGGMMAGATIGSMFGPWGTAIGAVGGAIAGLFGSGKTAAQKAEEERQKKQMAMDMEKQAIDITSAAIDSMHKALEMFKALADHVDVPRAAIKSFFATLEKVTKMFLSLAGKFAKDNMEAAKLFAESMGPVVELMGGALQVFEGLRFYSSIPEAAIRGLAEDIGRAAELMGKLAADIEANVVKKAMKFSKQMQIVVEMIGTAIESFVKLQDYKGVATYVMGWFFQDLQTATDMMGEIADNISRNMLNKAKTYAERIGVIVQAIGASVTALTALRTYESVPQAAFDALGRDVLSALSMIDNLVGAAEMYLGKAITFEDLVRRIVGALDSGVGLIRSVGGSALSPAGSGTELGMRASSGSSTVDRSIHFGDFTLSPGQAGYSQASGLATDFAAVQRISRAR